MIQDEVRPDHKTWEHLSLGCYSRDDGLRLLRDMKVRVKAKAASQNTQLVFGPSAIKSGRPHGVMYVLSFGFEYFSVWV